LKVKLLQSLGLKSTLITDGSSPINLFNTAHGLIGGKLPSLSGDNDSTMD
jgi:major vault protein